MRDGVLLRSCEYLCDLRGVPCGGVWRIERIGNSRVLWCVHNRSFLRVGVHRASAVSRGHIWQCNWSHEQLMFWLVCAGLLLRRGVNIGNVRAVPAWTLRRCSWSNDIVVCRRMLAGVLLSAG